jgi:hypothetical protein
MATPVGLRQIGTTGKMSFVAVARLIPSVVIPGRRASVEPGIHFASERAAKWIPGSRRRRAPE